MKKWTQDEDAILESHYRDGGAIACRRNGLTRSQGAMRARAEKLGFQPPRVYRTFKPKQEPAWALPRHDLIESLDCVRLRNWRGPVSRGPFVPILGRIVPNMGTHVLNMREAA